MTELDTFFIETPLKIVLYHYITLHDIVVHDNLNDKMLCRKLASIV